MHLPFCPRTRSLARLALMAGTLLFFPGETRLAASLVGGEETAALPEEVLKLRERAEKDDGAAALQLGDIYATGRGVRPDVLEAEKWYRRAGDFGEQGAASRLGDLLVSTSGAGAGADPARKAAGLQILREAAPGDAASQIVLGLYHTGGVHLPQDLEAATRCFQAAADLGDPIGLFRLGWLHSGEANLPGEIRPDQALAWLEAGFAGGHVESGLFLARLLMEGKRVPQDDERAFRVLSEAATRGDSSALVLLSRAYEKGRGVATDPIKALETIREAASLGNAEAQNQLGLWQVRGWEAAGLAPGREEAAKWFTEAAKQGHAAAHYNLAMLLDAGYDPEKGGNPLAAAHLVAAASAGFGEAQDRLGSWYRDGRHVVADAVAAEGWFRRAASTGNLPATINLARILETRGRDAAARSEALALFRKAAEAGHPVAHFFLGRLLLAGTGGPSDVVVARAHVLAAADSGLAPAKELLPEIEKRLTHEQIVESNDARTRLKVTDWEPEGTP